MFAGWVCRSLLLLSLVINIHGNSPLGVRFATENSAFPAAINAAATFNRDLIYKRGVAMGAEFRGKGVNVALSPMMNMMRAPEGGRAWEGWGGDPFLASAGAEETVKGIQSQGVQAWYDYHFHLPASLIL
jgi:beta-glucosidase